MDDDFYEGVSNVTSPIPGSVGLAAKVIGAVLGAPSAIAITILLSPLLLVIATRLLSGRTSEKVRGKDERTVWRLPYWIPVVGHGLQFLLDPIKLMVEARDQSAHGIFALNLGATTHNIISDPGLVKGVMQQKESAVQFHPIAWAVVERFFGFRKSSKPKYDAVWEEFLSHTGCLMREPHLGNMLKATIRSLEQNIPQMISFMESEIDQQPWERYANATYISDSETEIDLMSLMRDMMGNASVPALFGQALMEKYPELLHDVYDMDAGMYFFLMGLPSWTPWPGVMKAHLARTRAWQALDDHQMALDAITDGKAVDPTWGELDDVSEFIMRRHATFKNNGFEIKERGDLSMLWALAVNANVLVFWQILHILATPSLTDRIRAEVTPYVQISKPTSISNFFEAPKLTISHEGLSKKCPLFRSTFLEALRLCSKPWSVRQIATDVVISKDKNGPDPASFILHKGEYITIPHDLHMQDPRYFANPEKFDPERFISRNEDGSLSADMGTMRPYGGGPSMCKGRVFAERECLALVAGVLMFWDIEPSGTSGTWAIPNQKKTSAVSLPVDNIRVRIKRRRFDWEL